MHMRYEATAQADYILEMAERLAVRVSELESHRDEYGTPLAYGRGATQVQSLKNVDRMITQLRAELLELRRIGGYGEIG